MSIYSIAVFLHIVGALGLFAGVALEQTSLVNLRRATAGVQVREWLSLLGGLRRFDGPSGILILATGFYMVAMRWGNQAWIGLALLGMVLMAVLGIAVTGRRAAALKRALPASDQSMSSAFRQRLDDPMLRASASLRATIALGIVFNMSVKPAAAGALATMGVALALGAVVAAVGWMNTRKPVPSGPRAAAPERVGR